MNDSNIKNSVDEAIGKEQWLTDELVSKMVAKPPRRQRFKQAWQPLAAMIAVISLGTFLYFLPQDEYPEQVQLMQAEGEPLEDGVLKEAYKDIVYSYFTAIEQRDYEAYEKVSRTQTVASPKEVFIKYQNVDFATMEIYKTIPLGQEIKLYVRHLDETDGQTYLHTIYLQPEAEIVSEDIYENWPIYEEFLLPQEIDLTYEEKEALKPVSKYDTLLYNQAADTIELSNGLRLMQMQTDDGIWQLLKVFDIEDMSMFTLDLGVHEEGVIYADVPRTVKNDREFISIYNDSSEHYKIIFYSETLDAYQMASGETGGYGVGAYVLDFHDEAFFFLQGNEDHIITFKDDRLIAANIIDAIDVPEWQKDFLSVEMVGNNVSLKYNEDYFQKSQYYHLKTLTRLVP